MTPPPSDAIVLFDGKNQDEWVSVKDKSPAKWTVAGGEMTVSKGEGSIETTRSFKNYQLHVEWKVPANITGSGQARGNSGVFLASTGPGDSGYELQVLDSYNNKTYVNGMAGSLYKQAIPLAKMCIRDSYYVIPTPYPSTRIFGRIDYQFNDKNRLTSSIAVRDANSPVYDEWTCPVACYHDDTSDYSSQTSDVWSFSSTFVNELRFSFNRQGSFLTPYSLNEGIPSAIGLQYAKANVFPNINITGNICCDSPYAGTNTIYAQNVYQPSDVVTLIRGKHILHFGGELIMLQDNSTNWGNVDAGDFSFSGQYTQASLAASGSGAGWADFLLGDVQSWGANNSPLFGGRQKSCLLYTSRCV